MYEKLLLAFLSVLYIIIIAAWLLKMLRRLKKKKKKKTQENKLNKNLTVAIARIILRDKIITEKKMGGEKKSNRRT